MNTRPLSRQADVVVVGSGVGPAVLNAMMAATGMRVAWVETDPADDWQGTGEDAALISPLLSTIPAPAPGTGERLRSLALGRTVDWGAVWSKRRDFPFLVRRAFERRADRDLPTQRMLAALVSASLKFYLTAPEAAGSADHFEMTGAIFLGDDGAAVSGLLQYAERLDTPLIELPGGADAMAAGARRMLLCQKVWAIQSTATVAALIGKSAARRSDGPSRCVLARAVTNGAGWRVFASGETIEAPALVVASANAVPLIESKMLARLPLGRMVQGRRHFAYFGGDTGTYVDVGQRFVMQQTSRGALVTLAPSLHPSRSVLRRRLESIVAGPLADLVGEPRDEIALSEFWSAPDGLPIVGAVPGVSGLWIAQCPAPSEAALMPGLGRMLLNLMQGNALPSFQDVFGVDRLLSRVPRKASGTKKEVAPADSSLQQAF
jgi:D-amino-acid dehydrogenase